MEVQYDNPYEVGMTGLLGMPSGYYSMHEAEVLVMLGTDFPYSAFLPDDIKIVQVDIKPERLGRRAKVDHRALRRCTFYTPCPAAYVATKEESFLLTETTETL